VSSTPASQPAVRSATNNDDVALKVPATTAITTSTVDTDAMELSSPTNGADMDRTVLYHHAAV